MKLHDALVGAIVLVLGALVAGYARTLTPPRHLAYGPGFFPLLIGIGLMAVGAGITVGGLRSLRRQPVFVAPDWVHSAAAALRFWILPGAILFYLLVVDRLGFLLTATAILAAIMAVNGLALPRALALALVLSAAVNAVFASILHVPLPWGVLTPVSGWLIW